MPHKPGWLEQARSHWRYKGQERPNFATVPGEDQESVWDYPRPPRVEAESRPVVIRYQDVTLGDSTHCLRVLETASPPTVYMPQADLDMGLLQPCSGHSFCEWKGEARYWALVLPERRIEQVAWDYPSPLTGFETVRDHLAFYPAKVACFVAGHRVKPQPGQFYGGWVTPELVGPFKGEPGSEGW